MGGPKALLEACLFGPFEIRRGGQAVSLDDKAWGQRKTQSLLKFFLAHRGQVLSTDQLIEALYPPESDPEKLLRNLQGRISQLRRVLEPDLEKGPDSRFIQRVAKGSYRFCDEDCCRLDVEAFEDHLEQAGRLEGSKQWAKALSAYQAAIALYRGDFLAEDPYEEWTLAPRERLRERFLGALERAGECHVRLGQYEEAIGLACQALERDPIRESAYGQLMRYYTYAGQRQKALQAFETCVRMLDQELGIEPSSPLQTLRRQIERNELAPPERTIPHNLPQPLTDFIGRGEEIEQVHTLLFQTKLLTLTGVGGSGKTRLALELGHQTLSSFKDGVWFVDLGTLSKAALVAQAIAAVLNVREVQDQPPIAALTDHLRNKQCLVLLDNCEHLIEGCAPLVNRLLQACQHLQIVCTSREPLNLGGEIAWTVLPMSFPHESCSPERALEYDAVRLFVERARSSRPGFRFSQDNATAVIQLCRKLDGLPLALELAATRLRMLSIEQLTQRLDDRFALLSRGDRTSPPRQQALWTMIDWSYRLLSPKAQRLFPRLSVFVGSFSLGMAERICSGRGIKDAEVLDLLTELSEKSLLIAFKRSRRVRYRFLETVRQYGEERLQAEDETAPWRDRHLAWCLALAERAETRFHDAKQAVWMERLDSEYPHLRSALSWSLAGRRIEPGLRLGAALWGLWLVHGHWSEGRGWMEELLALGEGTQSRERARLLYRAGLLAWYQGDFDSAFRLSRESLSLAKRLDDEDSTAWALNVLGNVTQSRSQLARADILYRHSLEKFRRLDYPWETAVVLHNLGDVAWGRGKLEAAIQLHEESHGLFEELGDLWGIAMALTSLGTDLVDAEEYERADGAIRQALEIRQTIGATAGITTSLIALGELALARKDYSAAKAHLSKSLPELETLEGERIILVYLEGVAKIALHEEQPERAAWLWGGAKALREKMKAPRLPYERSRDEQFLTALAAKLRAEELAACMIEGKAMPLQDLIAEAAAIVQASP